MEEEYGLDLAAVPTFAAEGNHQYCSKIDSNFTRESREVCNENECRIENHAKYSAIHVKIFQTTLQSVFCGKTVTQNVAF